MLVAFAAATASAWMLSAAAHGGSPMAVRAAMQHFRENRGLVVLRFKPAARRSVVPKNIPLEIVFEDGDLLVINKVPGMTVQLAHNAVENAVVFHLNSTSGQYGTPSWPWNSEESFEGIVHRLDKDTSGLLAIGKHPQAARALDAAFRDRRVHKTYIALGVGVPSRRPSASLSELEAANYKASRCVPNLEAANYKASRGVPMQSTLSSDVPAAVEDVAQDDADGAVEGAVDRAFDRSEEGAANEEAHQKGAEEGAADEEAHQKRLVREIKGCGQDGSRALAILEHAYVAGQRPGAPCYLAAMEVCERACARESFVSREVDETTSRWTRLSRLASARRDRVTDRRASMHGAEAGDLRGAALALLERMRTRGVLPSVMCFQVAIGMCSREPPLWRHAVELVSQMQAAGGVGATEHCVSSAISACGRAGELEAAISLLELARVLPGVDVATCTRAAIRAAERCGAPDTARALAASFELRSSSFPGGPNMEGAPNAFPNMEGAPHAFPNMEPIVVDAPIGKMSKYTMGLMAVKEGGKEARSIVTPVAYDGVHSLSRIVIETGRTHQIRVHMASVLGCPLAGDAEYGGPGAKRRRRGTALGTHLGSARAPVERVMLHAVELTLPHPVTGVAISLRCEPPPDFLALAGAMMPLSLKV